MHDPRVGRFFATDPLEFDYPWNSPYAYSENRVIDSVELEGLENGWYVNKNYKVVWGVGPRVDYFKGKLDAIHAASMRFTNPKSYYGYLQILEKTAKQNPGYKPSTSNISCACATCIQKRNPHHFLAAHDPVMPHIATYILTGGTANFFARTLPEANLISKAVSTYNKLSPVRKFATKVTLNVASQTIANGGKVSQVNVIEALSSGIEGKIPEIPVVIGETFSLKVEDIQKAQTVSDLVPAGPKVFSMNGLKQWGLQMYGGLASNEFSNATENYLKGEKGGKIVGEFFNFTVETISNALPAVVPDDTEAPMNPDDFKNQNN